MSKRHSRPDEADAHSFASRLPGITELFRLALLAGATALIVVTPLMPSEAVAMFGVNAPVTTGWLVLLVLWAGLTFLEPARRWSWDWLDGLLLAVVLWHTLSGCIALSHGNPRATLNSLWLGIGYAASYWLIKQLVRSEREKRAIIVTMLALGAILAGHGLYQYFVSFPQTRADYNRDPSTVMRQANVHAEPGTPEADQFRNRIEAKEPLASFALANSLAGYLAPWLVVTLGLLLASARNWGRMRLASAALAAVAALLMICLLLTKSRTGVLAVGAGSLLVLLYCRPSGFQVSWKLTAMMGGTLVALVGIALATKGLDRFVLTEAPKSFQYRLEYWRATWALMMEHPTWGVGPGNFQDWYPRYKLPQASETVGDPHNYLLELAATAGLPALALLVVWQTLLLARWLRSAPATSVEKESEIAAFPAYWAILAGIALGVFLVLPFDLMVSFPPALVDTIGLPVAWVIGGPIVTVVFLTLHRWILEGEISPCLLIVALITLGVNLLAAGSLYFPGVMVTACVFAALLSPNGVVVGSRSTARSWIAICVSGLLLLLAQRTFYQPILSSQTAQLRFLEAQTAVRPTSVVPILEDWIAADPWSAEPWRNLAEVELQRWTLDLDDSRAAFLTAAERTQELAPNSSPLRNRAAECYWSGWKLKQDQECRDLALATWKRAVAYFPNSNYLHAQYAWALAESGDLAAAMEQAEQALALDALNPHREQKLANRKLFDPNPGAESPSRPESAEASVRNILGRP